MSYTVNMKGNNEIKACCSRQLVPDNQFQHPIPASAIDECSDTRSARFKFQRQSYGHQHR
eukprot:3129127-Pyramimonas_sp.AAC.1